MLVLEATTRKTVKLANINTESDGKQLRKLKKKVNQHFDLKLTS